jgi:hypothetical protein
MEKPVSRRVVLEDFFVHTHYQKISNDFIAKNQTDFGHKKRIKP